MNRYGVELYIDGKTFDPARFNEGLPSIPPGGNPPIHRMDGNVKRGVGRYWHSPVRQGERDSVPDAGESLVNAYRAYLLRARSDGAERIYASIFGPAFHPGFRFSKNVASLLQSVGASIDFSHPQC